MKDDSVATPPNHAGPCFSSRNTDIGDGRLLGRVEGATLGLAPRRSREVRSLRSRQRDSLCTDERRQQRPTPPGEGIQVAHRRVVEAVERELGEKLSPVVAQR